MGFDLMDWCDKNQNICIFLLALIVLQCTGYLTKILNMFGLEGLDNMPSGNGSVVVGRKPEMMSADPTIGSMASRGVGTIAASEELGHNEVQKAVTGLGRTPSTCYPQQKLKPADLLPTDESKAIQEFNIAKPVGEGVLQGVNMLDSTYHVGVNTVGQSLRNANLQLRSEPPNPQVNVSPWMNTTIGPDLPRRPLEIGESCPAGSQ
uniref:Minor capsid protein P11 C-terminal conserved region domain-containing protein n=1 Tax=viral metagenome TaxID=1070528 RepID=A0A6C0FFS1_9ZZZZ|tara:strand:+ start:6918 stop:7535 length:618 start_codon:yes stop_codon:yes gene_type:complete